MDSGLYEMVHNYFKSEYSNTSKRYETVIEEAIWIREEKMAPENITLQQDCDRIKKSILEPTASGIRSVKDGGAILVPKGRVFFLQLRIYAAKYIQRK